MSGIFITQQRAPMTTDIVKRAEFALFCAGHHDGIGINIQREEVTGLANFAGVPGEQPTGPPDAFHIHAVHVWVGVERLG
jgi:hypothetical protein